MPFPSGSHFSALWILISLLQKSWHWLNQCLFTGNKQYTVMFKNTALKLFRAKKHHSAQFNFKISSISIKIIPKSLLSHFEENPQILLQIYSKYQKVSLSKRWMGIIYYFPVSSNYNLTGGSCIIQIYNAH